MEIEENNRIGKTRDLFKKIRDTKGTFHTKMGTTKERKGMGLTEAGTYISFVKRFYPSVGQSTIKKQNRICQRKNSQLNFSSKR